LISSRCPPEPVNCLFAVAIRLFECCLGFDHRTFCGVSDFDNVFGCDFYAGNAGITGQVGVYFSGLIEGTITCPSGSMRNKFIGVFPGTFTNAGTSCSRTAL
jgi:hypothetical protein